MPDNKDDQTIDPAIPEAPESDQNQKAGLDDNDQIDPAIPHPPEPDSGQSES